MTNYLWSGSGLTVYYAVWQCMTLHVHWTLSTDRLLSASQWLSPFRTILTLSIGQLPLSTTPVNYSSYNYSYPTAASLRRLEAVNGQSFQRFLWKYISLVTKVYIRTAAKKVRDLAITNAVIEVTWSADPIYLNLLNGFHLARSGRWFISIASVQRILMIRSDCWPPWPSVAHCCSWITRECKHASTNMCPNIAKTGSSCS